MPRLRELETGVSRNISSRMRAGSESLFQPMSSPLRSAKTAPLTGGNFRAAWLFVPFGKQSRGPFTYDVRVRTEGEGGSLIVNWEVG